MRLDINRLFTKHYQCDQCERKTMDRLKMNPRYKKKMALDLYLPFGINFEIERYQLDEMLCRRCARNKALNEAREEMDDMVEEMFGEDATTSEVGPGMYGVDPTGGFEGTGIDIDDPADFIEDPEDEMNSDETSDDDSDTEN